MYLRIKIDEKKFNEIYPFLNIFPVKLIQDSARINN